MLRSIIKHLSLRQGSSKLQARPAGLHRRQERERGRGEEREEREERRDWVRLELS